MNYIFYDAKSCRYKILVFLLAVGIFSTIAFAWDIPSDVAICTTANVQDNPMIVSDGNGGAIVTWEDDRNGTYDIYAQRISASGVPQWTTNGVAVCTTSYAQVTARLISNGNGGAIITWQDYRNGSSNSDIYAQSINSSGVPQWTINGVAVCTATNFQQFPVLISDDSGGAIITWQDNRPSGMQVNIYAQRINASGISQWTTNGVVVCNAEDNQYLPEIISDGYGGAIISWFDYRHLDTNTDIYAQRINASGIPQWTLDGVAVCTAYGPQYQQTQVSDDSGGAIFTWEDYVGTSADIYAQRINASGVPQWTINGLAVCTAANAQYYPVIISDNNGGAIITWQDTRNGNSDIYAQSITAAGFVIPIELIEFEIMEASTEESSFGDK